MSHQVLQPPGWVRPKGYANGIAASGRMVFTAGVIGWNAQEHFEHADFIGQFRQALVNTRDILAEAGAGPADIVRMTCYITDKREYLAQIKQVGETWLEVLGKVFPCMAVVEVSALVEDAAKIEIETTAIVAENSP